MPSTQAGVGGHKQLGNGNNGRTHYINGNDVVYLFRRPDVNATWNQGWEVVDVFGVLEKMAVIRLGIMKMVGHIETILLRLLLHLM